MADFKPRGTAFEHPTTEEAKAQYGLYAPVSTSSKIEASTLVEGEMLTAFSEFERGQRDVLNKLLALNPEASAKLAAMGGGGNFADPLGRLPFDAAFWIATVAEQMGIKSVEELSEARP